MKYLIILLLSIQSLNSLGQNISNAYLQHIKVADSLFTVKSYEAAALEYEAAFKANNDQAKVKHRYFAASCWALSNNPDKAFYQLDRIVTKGKYSNYYQITNDSNFKSLKNDKRWKPLIKAVENNAEEEGIRLTPKQDEQKE